MPKDLSAETPERLKPTETWWAFFAMVVAAIGGVAGVVASVYVGIHQDLLNSRTKNYDIMSGNLATLLTSNDEH